MNAEVPCVSGHQSCRSYPACPARTDGAQSSETKQRKGYFHGLINIIDNKAKCFHLKKLTCKGTGRQVFFIVGDTVSHVGIFNPAM
jgi:hypothetical protein